MDALVGVAVELEDYTINRWGHLSTIACGTGCCSLHRSTRSRRLPRLLNHAGLCDLSVTEGIEALAVTRVIVRPTGALARQGIVKNAQVLFRP